LVDPPRARFQSSRSHRPCVSTIHPSHS